MEELDISFANAYMGPGEYVQWRGCPQKGNLVTGQDAFMIPFSILWCGFAIFWTILASRAGVFALFGLPFVAVGLYLVFGRFIWTALRRKRTVYVITNQKIIRNRMGRIDMLNRDSNLPVQLRLYKNGCGTITIGMMPADWHYGGGRVSWTDSSSRAFTLENIEEPARVQRILSEKN